MGRRQWRSRNNNTDNNNSSHSNSDNNNSNINTNCNNDNLRAYAMPSTHLEYSFVNSLVIGVRALDLRELEQNNHEHRGLGTLEFEAGSFGRPE